MTEDGPSAGDRLAASLARIAAREAAVKGWVHIDADGARNAARELDRGEVTGPLSGMPIGVKDVIDVEGMPTTHGSALFAGNIPERDAECVRRLRAAGAIILGKTVTAEFATYSPGPTDNPRKAGHTPGGSSSGSAAVVADGHVPLALGTQTAGSVIRPASFCGTLGFKPSFGRYPLEGVLPTSAHLDTLGLFAARLEDLLAADAVLAEDDAVPAPKPAPVVGLCRSPAWPQAEPLMVSAFEAFAARLAAAGLAVVERELPQGFDALIEAQALIHRREASELLGHIRRDHPDAVSAAFRELIDAGAAESDQAYEAALALQASCKARLGEVFDSVDMLLVPGAPGPAPKGLSATGNPVFQRLWTALGVPCLGFPGAWTDDGLPLGLQLIGAPGKDRQLIADARTILSYAPLQKE